MDIRKNLKWVISDRGFTQATIAKKAGMSPCQLSQILKLNRKLDANEMFLLCEAIGMTPMELAECEPRIPDKKGV